MKMDLRTCALLLCVIPLAISCSGKPSEDTIKAAITESFKHEVPVTWSGSLMGGKDGRVELIEIRQIGKFNEHGKYWPVKARVKGTCKADLLFRTELKSFDREGDFQLHQDDYGKWKASTDFFQ